MRRMRISCRRGASHPGFWDADQLYDLKSDPGEKKNVAAAHPEIVAQMGVLLESSRTESKEWPVKK